jgi:hypothetical protein
MLGHDEAQEVIGGQPPAAIGGFGIGHTHQHEHSREQLHGLNRIAVFRYNRHLVTPLKTKDSKNINSLVPHPPPKPALLPGVA